jgi:hypothetical protein
VRYGVHRAGSDARSHPPGPRSLPPPLPLLFQVVGCFEGKPYYKRDNSKSGADRYLYYTPLAGAWDFAPSMDDPLDSTVLVYSEGEFGFISDRPQLVAPGQWYLSTDQISKPKSQDAAFEARNEFLVECAKVRAKKHREEGRRRAEGAWGSERAHAALCV